jgi:hypothetical protein
MTCNDKPTEGPTFMNRVFMALNGGAPPDFNKQEMAAYAKLCEERARAFQKSPISGPTNPAANTDEGC